jgi:sirohydrochlorin cobaltochelatase
LVNGVLLFAHGARDPQWAAPFKAIAAQLQAQAPELHVALAFLELMEPGLDTAAAQLAAAGCTEVTVVPLFLGSGGHVRQDLPRLVAQVAQQHPQVRFRRTAAIGETDAVIRAIAGATLALVRAEDPRTQDAQAENVQPQGGAPLT